MPLKWRLERYVSYLLSNPSAYSTSSPFLGIHGKGKQLHTLWVYMMTDTHNLQAAKYHPDRNPEGGEKVGVIYYYTKAHTPE